MGGGGEGDGGGVRTHVNSKGKSVVTGKKFSSEENRTQAGDSEPNTLPTELSRLPSGDRSLGLRLARRTPYHGATEAAPGRTVVVCWLVA